MEQLLLALCFSLSFLTTEERLIIIGNLKHDYESEFKCKHSGRFDQFKDSANKQREIHNITSFCDGRIANSKPSYAHQYEDMQFRTCPCTFYDPEMLTLYELENGFNNHGPSYIYSNRTVTTMPAKIKSAFRIIRNYLNKRDTDKTNNQEKEVADMLNKHNQS